MKLFNRIIFTAIVMLMIFACNRQNITRHSETQNTEDVNVSFRQITHEAAEQLMEEKEGYIILDVRTQNEYNGGHIPGAVCIPNETIDENIVTKLPDKSQMILVYCRSGRRSKLAAQKLARLGYTNVLEFGGINSWQGEIEK